jgi:uncharacterized protein (TIGR03437 family)
MTIYLRRAAAVVALTFSVATVYAQRRRLSGPLDNGRRITLAGRVPSRARTGIDLGRVPGTFPLPDVTLYLKPSADLTSLLRDQQDPSSPQYHQWLTPEQYAGQFGAAQADIDQIAAWLQSQGLTLVRVARGRDSITVSGTADQVQGAFQTQIHQYNVNGKQHYANATDPSVPAALAPLVAGIRGLHDFHPKPRIRAASPNLLNGSFHAIGPDDFAAIYNVAPLYQAGMDGTGQKIAVVGQTALQPSDLTSFRTKFGLPALNLQTILTNPRANPGISADDLNEANLDIEWSGAVARNATIVYVYSSDVWTSATYAVDNNVAPVLSMSYGSCELADLADLPLFQQAAQRANAQGMTWFAASGDSGAADCDDSGVAVAQNAPGVDAPGSIPEITSMGGTEFNEQGDAYWSSTGAAQGYIPEKVWNDTAFNNELSSGGGGASVFFPQPAWQSGPGVPNDGARHVPDVSFTASANHDGYYVVVSGSPSYFGGTSAAAPTMAGIAALLNQYLVSTGAQPQAGLGNINPALYRLAQTAPAVFHDVTIGDNIVPCASGVPGCNNGSYGNTASSGYDQASGLGSVDATALVHGWNGAAASRASAITISIDQNPVFQQAPDASGNPWRFQLTLTEEAGVGTTLTGLTINGVSYTAQIASLFKDAGAPWPASTPPAIAPRGSITANIGLKNLSVPTAVPIVVTGVDASGATWSSRISVPVQGPQVHVTIAGIGNAASGKQSYAPGEIVAVYGTAFSNITQVSSALPLPQFLEGFEATINGNPAPIYYVSPNQVNVQIPYETTPGTATLVLGNSYENAPNYSLTVASAAPGIFIFPDGTVNPSRTAARGQVATLFITGDGAVTPSVTTGSAPSPRGATPRPRQAVSVTVGGVDVGTPQFLGIPSWAVGVTQINFTIPSSVPPGPQPVVVTVGGQASNTATIVVQ